MRRVLACVALVLAALLGAAPISRAADGDNAPALPMIINLGCVPRCAAITEPVPDRADRLNPANLDLSAWVELQYIVKADGQIGDIMVTRLTGPEEYAGLAKSLVKKGTYKPATMDGVAIDRDLTSVIRFHNGEGLENKTWLAYPGQFNDQTPAFDTNYRISQLIGDNKLEEASESLNAAQQKLSGFFEASVLASYQAIIALKRADYAKARRWVEGPVFFANKAGEHDGFKVASLVRIRLQADLNVGDLQDAQDMLTYQKRIGVFHQDDPLVKEVEKLKATIDGAPAFTVDAEIAPSGADSVVFGLYRRTFSLRNVSGGALDKLIIRCQQQSVESDFSPRAEWHIPKNWNDCQVTLRGTPDTKFQIVQFAN